MAAYGDNHAEWGAAALDHGVPAGDLDERHAAQIRLCEAAEAVYDAVDVLEAVAGMALEGRSSEGRPTVEVARARVEVEQRRFAATVDAALTLVGGGR
ncbi:MAG: hypothetical protein WKF33_07670 [Thermoleophilaceae bacterium]